jgi:GT2 family glycosyltransferase
VKFKIFYVCIHKEKYLNSLPSVAVVVLNWNGKNYLEKFLPSVMAATYKNVEIFVADNASDDDSVPFLKKNYPAIKIILNDANEGFAKGYNSALHKIAADYYVLLNNDVEVAKDWIEPVILLMESDNKIAACQPKILSFENKGQFEYAGASGGFIDKLGYPFARGRIFETCEPDRGQYDNSIQIFWATGAALFVRSKVFHELNGFDEYFFAHQEEIDLCWRMHRAGYAVYAVPSSVVYHVGGGTLPAGNRRKVFLNFRNNLIMMSKNLPLIEACLRIPVRISLDFMAAYKALLAGDFDTYISITSAHIHYVKWLFLHKKIEKLPKIRTGKLLTVYDRSIVWQYFIKKRKTFLEINSFKK